MGSAVRSKRRIMVDSCVINHLCVHISKKTWETVHKHMVCRQWKCGNISVNDLELSLNWPLAVLSVVSSFSLSSFLLLLQLLSHFSGEIMLADALIVLTIKF